MAPLPKALHSVVLNQAEGQLYLYLSLQIIPE